MAKAWVTEYRRLGDAYRGGALDLALEPAIKTQAFAFTTATSSGAFNASTAFVRLIADANCHVEFGDPPSSADSDSQFVPANTEVWRAVIGGHSVNIYDGTS